MEKTINDCNGASNSNATACCDDNLLVQMQQCEQCMFNFLVAKNIPPPLVQSTLGQSINIVGSNPALAGLISVCKDKNVTLNAKVALSIAPNWDGPLGIGLSLGATIVVVGTGAIMGASALWILSTIE